MHVLPIAFQLFFLSTPPSLLILSVPPLSLRPGLYHLFWLPSILSPHLFLLIFLCFVHCPPSLHALSVLVQPRPLFPPAPPISALVLPSDPTPCPPLPSTPTVPPADARDPKSSCSSLDCSPFKFFFGGGLITVASKLHTKSQRGCYCEAYNGIQAVMAISNRGARPVSGV